MAFTKQEIKEIAITALLTGYVSTPGTITAADSILVAIEKDTANLALTNIQVGALQVGNNLFNYYNFK